MPDVRMKSLECNVVLLTFRQSAQQLYMHKGCACLLLNDIAHVMLLKCDTQYACLKCFRNQPVIEHIYENDTQIW